ncbi:hypothetical protein IQ226_19570 [Dolichospermum sp. LEGE 00240]|jgi:predicted nucleic acid-binding protein|nr:hypothetical protein [Dolichospermum sp. LEGE 00240]MBE9251285.1 hypothetical protein [Dolichospermum sp. LEGE 00240]MDM3853133.1 hypothetical protein [Aphanizomenon gracile PMC627.10]MDM3855622.1 hypothetical protein [Aphanizomenon gracile PMC649.10]MDM3862806.1 hypothetical protein [Aphanizomenon gracile PMC644.10]
MMLLDSNIIIYAAQAENEFLREFIAENILYYYQQMQMRNMQKLLLKVIR